MSRKAKISGLEKIATFEKYLRGEDSLNHLATVLGVHHSTIQQWHQTYQSLGPSGLHNASKNTAYPSELKTKTVEDYLSGCGSLMEICKRYGHVVLPTSYKNYQTEAHPL
ncbi:helix-turn-helix domain-containing protein [Desulfosporosinus fructosivorans]